MAPRQRLSPGPSIEISSSSSSSSEDRPLLSESSPSNLSRNSSPKTSSTADEVATAADIAREQHDVFNLVALLFVVGTTLINWDFTMFLKGYGPAVAWTGRHFYLNWATTLLYFLVDLLWVASVPICVKSPGVIIKHHIVAMAYLSAPVAWPQYRWFMGACLSVEINTWFLILRRVVYKRNLPTVITEMVSISFYVSWLVIRCFIYPAIFVIFLQLAVEKVHETGQLWHWPMLFIPVHFFLCVLNLKWSYDLFEPIIRRCLFKNGDGPIISSGL